MTVPAKDKPMDSLRQEVIDQLVLNYAHQAISREAFEQRLDDAYDAVDHDTLTVLVSDLEHYQDSNYDFRRDHMLYADESSAEASEWIVNIFSGTHRNHEEIVPATIRIFNFCGGCEIDYSLALFSAPVTHIKTFNIMGGAHIYVPEGVRVKTRIIPLFGGTTNRSEPDNDPNSPTIIISGLALFGGLDIGIKRTFRERMQDFADDIKQMFN